MTELAQAPTSRSAVGLVRVLLAAACVMAPMAGAVLLATPDEGVTGSRALRMARPAGVGRVSASALDAGGLYAFGGIAVCVPGAAATVTGVSVPPAVLRSPTGARTTTQVDVAAALQATDVGVRPWSWTDDTMLGAAAPGPLPAGFGSRTVTARCGGQPGEQQLAVELRKGQADVRISSLTLRFVDDRGRVGSLRVPFDVTLCSGTATSCDELGGQDREQSPSRRERVAGWLRTVAGL